MTQINDQLQKRKRTAGAATVSDFAVAPVDAETGAITLTLTTDKGATFRFALDSLQAGKLGYRLGERSTDADLRELARKGAPDKSLIAYSVGALHNVIHEAGKTCQRRLRTVMIGRLVNGCGDEELAELMTASADWSKEDRERAVTSAKMIFKGYQPKEANK